MRYKPFLSHKRQQAIAVACLKQQLCARGAGGWKDTDELPLGGDFNADLVDAINVETGGFIYWGTTDTLSSRTICKIELPTALERAKRDSTYPVVPVFVELRPGRDDAAIAAAIGDDYARQLLGSNGLVRATGQSLRSLASDAARRYVKQLVAGLPAGPVNVAISAFRAPTEEHDLTLDWRGLFDKDLRTLQPDAENIITEALADIRDALQTRERCPQVTAEVTLPIPLAMLVGYEWRWTTQLQVTVKTTNPGSGETLVVAPGSPAPFELPELRTATLGGGGPFVLAVSVGATLGKTVNRYAAEQDARGFEHLHLDRDPATDPLNAGDIRALAAHIAKRLNALQAAGSPKHLLLRCPASLAVAIGLAANGTGSTRVPFYDGHDYYVGGLTIG